jgi:hypothetical protein
MNDLNLENLKAGDEVAVIFVNPRGTRDGIKYSGPKKVVLDEKGQFRTISQIGEIVPKDGKSYFFMSKRITPDYYFSANPKHLAAARKERDKRLAREQKKNDLLAKKRAALSPLLEEYTDREEGYSFEYLSAESLEKLSISQIETLKKWLTK